MEESELGLSRARGTVDETSSHPDGGAVRGGGEGVERVDLSVGGVGVQQQNLNVFTNVNRLRVV